MVDRNGRRLNILIADFLDLSRIETDRFKLSKAPFRIDDFLGELDLSFQPIFVGKSQSFHMEVHFLETWIEGDRIRLAQVISNLLTNVSKYSDVGSQIRLVARLNDSSLSVIIEDQGPGIRPEDLGKVCDLFFRAKEYEESTTPGTGVGLYVAKRIVELHGGTIILRSETGVGTSVTVEIPGVTPSIPVVKNPQESIFRTRFEEMVVESGA